MKKPKKKPNFMSEYASPKAAKKLPKATTKMPKLPAKPKAAKRSRVRDNDHDYDD